MSEVHGTCKRFKTDKDIWITINDKRYVVLPIDYTQVKLFTANLDQSYMVSIIGNSCTCPDATHRQRQCKHNKAIKTLIQHGKLPEVF